MFRNLWEGSISDATVLLGNQRIPKPDVVRILGQSIPQGRGNIVAIDRLVTTTEQVTGMLRSIRNRRHRLKKGDAARLVEAIAISRITYREYSLAVIAELAAAS